MSLLSLGDLKKIESMDNIFQDLIVGEYVLLRKVDITDAEDIFKWRSGYSGRFLRQPENYSVEGQKKWIESRGPDEINYIILDKKTEQKVGSISIYDVNHADKVSNVGRLLLSEEFLKVSNPYGLEALLLTYDYVLNKMDFRKITGDIAGANVPVFKLQKFLGMKQEGLLEKHVLIAGEYQDLYIMSIFKDGFNNLYKKKIGFLLKGFKTA
jgi:RimJ/RimL family protein N-acetyltransferase